MQEMVWRPATKITEGDLVPENEGRRPEPGMEPRNAVCQLIDDESQGSRRVCEGFLLKSGWLKDKRWHFHCAGLSRWLRLGEGEKGFVRWTPFPPTVAPKGIIDIGGRPQGNILISVNLATAVFAGAGGILSLD